MKWTNPKLTDIAHEDPEMMQSVTLHRMQIHACNEITELLEIFDQSRSKQELYSFQERLFAAVIRAQENAESIRRAIKRIQVGKQAKVSRNWEMGSDPDSRDMADWEIERLVADRIVRQLRSVGDCLAWRSVNYRRGSIIALSANETVGPMVGKSGLTHERKHIEDAWQSAGVFSVLHDLTTVLRLGDLTECGPDTERRVYEIKSGRKSANRQLELIGQAVTAMTGGGPMPPSKAQEGLPTYIFSSKIRYATSLNKIQELALIAERDAGVACASIGQGRVVALLDLVEVVKSGQDQEAILGRYIGRLARALSRAAPDSAMYVSLRSVDFAGRNPGMAPFGIYPLSPQVRAKLICDLLIFESTISLARLASLFERSGFTFDILVDGPRRVEATEPLVSLKFGTITATISLSNLGSLLLELIEPDRFVRALRDALQTGVCGRTYCITYEGEDTVWM